MAQAVGSEIFIYNSTDNRGKPAGTQTYAHI